MKEHNSRRVETKIDAFPRFYAAFLDVNVICDGACENVDEVGAAQRLQFDDATARNECLRVKKVPIFGLC